MPILLALHYLLMVARHEACHAIVAAATGAQVLGVHLWPPRAGNLSWILVAADRPRAAWEVQFQASAPYLVAIALVAASLFALTGRWRMPPFVRLNLWLAGVVFPLVDIGVAVATYHAPGHDLWFVFGPPDGRLRMIFAAWIVALGALALATAWWGRARES